jgi:hypothetical protein
MISTYEQLIEAIGNLNFGKPLFNLEISKSGIQFRAVEQFPDKDKEFEPKWLSSNIQWALSRGFDKETKNWKLGKEVVEKIQKSIREEVLSVITKCSDAKDVTRTALYKEYRAINEKHASNSAYYTDVIGIINYYYSSSTDTKCRSNVIGLFTILRKRYGTSSSSGR